MTPFNLKAVNLVKDYQQGRDTVHVLRGVHIELTQGKTYAITGVSGSGKSTLLHLLGGLDEPTSGGVFFNGENIFEFKPWRKELFFNTTVGFVFQFHYLIKELSVLENVILPGLVGGKKKKECVKSALELLEQVGMIKKINFYPGQLSGGEQQRVAVARAIFNKPAFLFADEPTGSLDEENAKGVLVLLLRCQAEWNMGVILCSHDEEIYSKMGKIFRVHNGVIATI
jgi:ABC-type lipoprotein export system ATPase subunit